MSADPDDLLCDDGYPLWAGQLPRCYLLTYRERRATALPADVVLDSVMFEIESFEAAEAADTRYWRAWRRALRRHGAQDPARAAAASAAMRRLAEGADNEQA